MTARGVRPATVRATTLDMFSPSGLGVTFGVRVRDCGPGRGRRPVAAHIPDEEAPPGTDAAVPYDRITDRIGELPADRNAPLAVVSCLTGRMGAVAVQTLRELGDTDVTELDGGTEAWRDDGRELLPPAGWGRAGAVRRQAGPAPIRRSPPR